MRKWVWMKVVNFLFVFCLIECLGEFKGFELF